jgi:hypothetical protein
MACSAIPCVSRRSRRRPVHSHRRSRRRGGRGTHRCWAPEAARMLGRVAVVREGSTGNPPSAFFRAGARPGVGVHAHLGERPRSDSESDVVVEPESLAGDPGSCFAPVISPTRSHHSMKSRALMRASECVGRRWLRGDLAAAMGHPDGGAPIGGGLDPHACPVCCSERA